MGREQPIIKNQLKPRSNTTAPTPTPAVAAPVYHIPEDRAAAMLVMEKEIEDHKIKLADAHMKRLQAATEEQVLERKLLQLTTNRTEEAKNICKDLGIDLQQIPAGVTGTSWHLDFIKRIIEYK